jgi:muramoyltetrapeptide carboxypeptidase
MPARRNTLKPRALRPGDTIGIIAPASSFNRADFEMGCNTLRSLGYRVIYDESIFDRDLYFAGSAQRRARELEQLFVRDDIKAILCARGGYGSNYLLPILEYKNIAAHPKILVGYSDLTSVMTYLYDYCGLISFHGPMVAKDFAGQDGFDVASWQAAVSGGAGFNFALSSGARCLNAGAAEGVLYGGCLSLLAESLGTPYEIQTDETILFIEDLATKPYQIDRMLMHLKLAGKLGKVRGLVFGEMLDCRQSPNQNFTLEEVIMRVVRDLNIPVAYGLRSGHVSRANITLPMGARVRFESSNSGVVLETLEQTTKS